MLRGDMQQALPLQRGEGKDSIQAVNSTAQAQNSTALGDNTIAGAKAYYVYSLCPDINGDKSETLISLTANPDNTSFTPVITNIGQSDGTISSTENIFNEGDLVGVYLNNKFYKMEVTGSSAGNSLYCSYIGEDISSIRIPPEITALDFALINLSNPSVGVVTLGTNSLARGFNTRTVGGNSQAEGKETIAFGNGSHAEGKHTVAGGVYSHAEGYSTQALKAHSHAEGNHAVADGL